MLFTSPLFLFVFFPLFLLLYYFIPNRINIKNLVTIFASILFFAWGEPTFVLILFCSTYLDYRFSLSISPTAPLANKQKKIILVIGIVYNVIILFYSKYLNFLTQITSNVFQGWVTIKPLDIPLILGISFITFHKISFLVDSYKGRTAPPRNFQDCLLYIFLFPQLIAGPIIRYHDIGAQIQNRKFLTENYLIGFFRFSLGLTKKVLIADPLGGIVDKVFAFPMTELSCFFAWIGIFAYTLQIYFDFSGYSDMAIGIGRMLGFYFPENFNRPYTATSVTDFWRRWHITLSNWMRIYLYIPLGGNRVSELRKYLNLWLVFLISGFWHGASWNFVVWGAYYGFFLSLEKLSIDKGFDQSLKLPSGLKRCMTFLVVLVGWVFFRSPSLSYAIDYLAIMFNFLNLHSYSLPWGLVLSNRDITLLILGAVISIIVFPKTWLEKLKVFPQIWNDTIIDNTSLTILALFTLTFLLLAISILAVATSNYSPFLYFRF